MPRHDSLQMRVLFWCYKAAPLAPAVSATSFSMNTLALPMFASTSATERPGTFSKHGPEKPAALRILGQKTEDISETGCVVADRYFE